MDRLVGGRSTAARHEVVHTTPVVLPGERLVLFASQTTDPGADRIESVSIDGGLRSVVVERAATPVWSPRRLKQILAAGGIR